MSKLVVVVMGGEPQEPLIIKSERTVASEFKRLIPQLSDCVPILIHAPVGAGKTYAITHELLPWALENGFRILYISSRMAINAQIKGEIIAETGEAHLIAEHTELGMQKQRDFKGITVLTYHALYSMMLHSPDELKKFDVLVFDEIHALLADAMFVPYTAYILDHLKVFFGGKIRLYLSATPEEILPYLMKAEAPYRLKVLRFRRNFSYVQPYFFHDEANIIRCINEDQSDHKWLLFSSSIKHGEHLKALIHHPARMLNSVAREQNPNMWDVMLTNKGFAEKVAIATAVVDAGVSFTDKALVNIVVFTYSMTTLVQVLGRKRRNGREDIKLFVWCPRIQDVCQKLTSNTEIQDALALHDTDYAMWADRYVVHPVDRDLRNFVRVDQDGSLQINSLAKVYLRSERAFLEKLIKRAKANHSDCGFDRLVAHCLNFTKLNFTHCWLDGNRSGKARADLDALLANAANQRMDEKAFSYFADSFRDLCVAAYGKGHGGKDRNDRAWGWRKIDNKLTEFGRQYRLQVDPSAQAYTILECREGNSAFDELEAADDE